LTWPFNLTRQPAASVPCGFVEGLPIGLQIVGPMFSEQNILRASCCVEQACATGARPRLGAGGDGRDADRQRVEGRQPGGV
jgi:aspartyl-tRNA(Asn)/glutamyl-tRNA(Gln) amidotransferase subunit A